MSPKQTILVHLVQHPIEKKNVTIQEVTYCGQTLAQLKKQFADNQDVAIVLEAEEINQKDWVLTQVKAGDKIVIGPAIGWPALFGFATWGSFLWAVAVNLAWIMGISYLGGVLFGQDVQQPKGVSRDESQSFGWNPRTTQQEGIPHPMCFGTNMHHGNVVARWTDVDVSGDELLYMIIDHGRGPIEGKGANIVYLNGQPGGNYPGVTIQERLGTLNQTCMTGFEKNKLEYRPQGMIITNADGSVTWTTPNNFFDDIEYTLEFPRGLWHYRDDGDRTTHSVTVKVEISERGAETWTTLFNESISASQLAPIYKAYSVQRQGFTCAHGKQYDLKFTKSTADADASRNGDELKLRSIREVVDVAFRRPGKALLGITALATSRLSGNIDVKWVSNGKLVPVYDGSSWSVEFTRNRAFVDLAIATQPVISGDGGVNPWVIERYEGMNPNRIDLAFIYEWAVWCADDVSNGNGGTEDRMTCDIIVDYQTDVWSLFYEIAQIGRMYPYWQGNVLTGWVDKAVTDVIDLVTFDNTMVRTWKNAYAGSGEMAGNAEVFYQDSLHGYERKCLPIPNENAGTYTRKVSIEGIGVKGHALATRVGNHTLNRNKLITNVNSSRMGKDALRYKLGSVVRLSNNIPNWGISYRVVQSTANNTVELDHYPNVSAGDILYIRSYDEINKAVSVDSYTVESVAGNVVTIVETWEITPAKNNIVAIGVSGSIKTRRIIKMRHTVDNYFDVEFETYNTELFDSDSFEPVYPNPDYVWAQPAANLSESLTRWEAIELINQMNRPAPNIEIPWISNCTWTGDDIDTVGWEATDADEPITLRYRGTTYEISGGDFSTTDEFIYWSPAATDRFLHTNVAATALAAGMWLVCTNADGVAHAGVPFQLIHAAIILAGTIRAEQYAQLRNTYVYNSEDSLDAAKPFTIPFRIIPEADDIVSATLSFRIMPYRAYSTGAAAGGGGIETSEPNGAIWGWSTNNAESGVSIDNTNLGSHGHTPGGHSHDVSGSTESEDGTGEHSHDISQYSCGTSKEDASIGSTNLGTHSHSVTEPWPDGHSHSLDNIDDHTHDVEFEAHTHDITYGIFEEANAPTIHYHIDDGAGFGGASGNYTADAQDIDISGALTIRAGTGWKNLRFDTDLRCRIFAIIELKLDITA